MQAVPPAQAKPSSAVRSHDDVDDMTVNEIPSMSQAAGVAQADDSHDAGHVGSGRTPDVLSLTDQTNLLPFRKVLAVFLGLSLCILVSCLDSTIVATALPTISDHFNAGSVSSWVPSSYLLTSTAFQPLCKFTFYLRIKDCVLMIPRREIQ